MTRRYTRSDNLALAMHIVVSVGILGMVAVEVLRW